MNAKATFDWFAPPTLPSADLQSRARALWLASWSFFAVIAVVLGLAVIVEPATLARREFTVGAVGILVLLLHMISRAGRPMLASWILVLGLSLVVTQRAWITGGIFAPVAVFYVLFIILAGMLIGVRGSIATAMVCLVGAIVLTAANVLEWLPSPPGATSPYGGFVFVLLTIGLALVVQALLTPLRLRREGLGLSAVQMLVHDMRSPIQILIGHLDLLREDPSQHVEDLAAAINGATTLQRMTNSLLDISRLEAGRMPVRRTITNLSALAQSVVTDIRVLQPTRDITVEVSGDSACDCDPDLTRRIIENLVSNAMKHTRIEGRVRVVTSGSRDKAYVEVHDEGPGVPSEQRNKLFEPYSAEGLRSATGFQSSGLGLAFCKLAVEAQGGTIRITDGRLQGSVFVVELPRAGSDSGQA